MSSSLDAALTSDFFTTDLLEISALLCYYGGGRGKAPGSPLWGCCERRFSGGRSLFYSPMIFLTLSRSSSSVSHLAISSRIARSRASVVFIPSMSPLLPDRGPLGSAPLPYKYIIAYLHVDTRWNIAQISTCRFSNCVSTCRLALFALALI